MLTHGYWHDFTVLILKYEEVMKIYRDHQYGLKLYHFISLCHFYITQHNLKQDLPCFIHTFIAE